MDCKILFSGNTENIKNFLKQFPDTVDVPGLPGNYTPLIYACSKNDYEKCKLLIDAGADVNKFDDNGRTALHYATFNINTNMIKILLEKNALPMFDIFGKTPFIYSLELNDAEVIRLNRGN